MSRGGYSFPHRQGGWFIAAAGLLLSAGSTVYSAQQQRRAQKLQQQREEIETRRIALEQQKFDRIAQEERDMQVASAKAEQSQQAMIVGTLTESLPKIITGIVIVVVALALYKFRRK